MVRLVSDVAQNEVSFEELYARAGSDLGALPWASLAAHPVLVAWLDRQPSPEGEAALVVGCGFGDDAEELRRRGYRVTAFDLAPTAIARCRERFPDSSVDYRVADLFALPVSWRRGFALVVEIRTLQSLPPGQREAAVRAIAATARSGGTVWVRCAARADDEPVATRPWPVSRRELSAFIRAGLRELEFTQQKVADGRGGSFTVVYQRP